MSEIEKEKFDPSVEPTSDKAHRIIRSALGLLPVGSGTALEFLGCLVEDPFQARRTKWLHELSDAINRHSIDIEELHKNIERTNAVLSTIIQSTDIALKTSDGSIHRILINFVLKTICTQEPDEELNSIYLSTLRQLTSSHLVLLKLISLRQRYERGAELEMYEKLFLEELKREEGISKSISPIRLLSDLESLQLIYSPPGSPWTSNRTNYCTKSLSEFAQSFLDFLSDIQHDT